MKSLTHRIVEYFNRRTAIKDLEEKAAVSRKTLVLENGAVASRLLKNDDFALMFNLYRFDMLNRLEDSKSDLERISNAHYVAGVRDFIDFVEKTEYFAKVAESRALKAEKKAETKEMG
jgi:hypothetical protein